MGLNLQSDDSTDNQLERDSGGTMQMHESDGPNNDYEEKEEDDFSDLEEDTIYLTNRYNNNNSYNTGSETSSQATILTSRRVPYIFFFLNIALFLGGFLLMALAIPNLNGTLLIVGRIIVTVGEIFAIVDAIIMKVKGYSVILIILAVFFLPGYWWMRCKEYGDSTAFGRIVFLVFIGLIGLYINNVFKLNKSLSETPSSQQPVTYMVFNGKTVEVVQQSTEQEEVNPEEEIARLQSRYFKRDGHKYTVGQIIKDNIQDPDFQYIPADGRYQLVPYVEVTGRTLLYGKDQKIVFDCYLNGNGLRRVKIGSKTYKSNKDLNQVLDDMIANTTPDVDW